MEVKIYWDFSKESNDHSNDTVNIDLSYDEYSEIENAIVTASVIAYTQEEREKFWAIYKKLMNYETYNKINRKRIQ